MTPPPRYRVEVSPAAERQIRKLEAVIRRRTLTRIETLQRNPRPAGVEKLSDSENLYRVRVGDFRIIYEIEDRIARVLVLKVGDRKEVYKR